jgi:acyl dehydratase
MSTAATTALRVEPGFAFPTETIGVDAAEQRRLHGHCGIPPERYGDHCDIGLLARRTITLNTAAIQASRPGLAPVHVVHRLRQHAPAALGEKFRVEGRYVEIVDARRGEIARSRWEYRRDDGALVLTVEPDVMMVDPARKGEAGGKRPATVPPRPDAGGWAVLTRKQCTPETTCGYCLNTTNLIHTDPATARRYGFRAPIIAGNQTVNFVLEALALEARPQSFDIEIRFRKPVFWDDAVAIEGRRGADGKLAELRAVNGEGVTVADATVNAVRYGG